MGKVAIQGHATRGLEVIGILEALGGKTCKGLNGTETSGFYYIDDNGVIRNSRGAGGVLFITCFTIEEFIEKYPYKIGDKVQHKGATSCGTVYVIERMKWANNHTEYEIRPLYDYNHTGLVTLCVEDLQPYKEETMEETIKIDIPKGYEFVGVDDNNQQVVLERIKPQYPKTYEECLKILGYNVGHTIPMNHGHKGLLIMELQRLLIFRDAYWKLVGDWKPDWEDGRSKYGLIVSGNRVKKQKSEYVQMKFCFPTEEVLDAFCENFDKPINNCKEML